MTLIFDPGNLTIEWDAEAKAAYVHISKHRVARTLEINSNMNVDLDVRGRLVGIEWIAPARVSSTIFSQKINLIARKYKTPKVKTAGDVLRRLVTA